MPPKKKPAKPADSAPASTRPTRSSTRAAAAAKSTTTQPADPDPALQHPPAAAPLKKAAPKPKKSTAAPKKGGKQQPALVIDSPDNELVANQAQAAMNGKRKRNSVLPTVHGNDGDVEIMNLPPEKKKRESKVSLAKFSPKRCEGWFVEYADPDTNEITGNTFARWLEDIGVSQDGAFMYYILWKCGSTTTITITRDEFVKAMTLLEVDTNFKLYKKLPLLMDEVKPVAKMGENRFMDFYKWCFVHFKASEQVKSVPLEIAEVLFETLLDKEKYSPSWTKTAASGEQLVDGTPRLNHVHAFIEFLKSDENPAKVVTRDQYQQFAQFNHDVAWDLKCYSEETSTWPTLIDNYVTWKKEHYPVKDTSA